MIVRNENALKFFSSGFDEGVVFGDVEKRVHQEALVARFDVVAVDGETASEELFDIEARSLIVGFDQVLVEDMGGHKELRTIVKR